MPHVIFYQQIVQHVHILLQCKYCFGIILNVSLHVQLDIGPTLLLKMIINVHYVIHIAQNVLALLHNNVNLVRMYQQ